MRFVIEGSCVFLDGSPSVFLSVLFVQTLLLEDTGTQHKKHAELLAVQDPREGISFTQRETVERNNIIAVCFGHHEISLTLVLVPENALVTTFLFYLYFRLYSLRRFENVSLTGYYHLSVGCHYSGCPRWECFGIST